ncbi:hypothetical protein AYO44_09600 [Planctomycetaceae bacterium SCGC AG-212-F19]|nr:hypothetical protein AYO44_09600 [Planctomycetaceae bacterium SCGC AG-212-F19]
MMSRPGLKRFFGTTLLVCVVSLAGSNIVSAATIFTDTHSYAYGKDPNAVVIRVDVFNNYKGNSNLYLWQYTVTNNSYDPIPGQTNGFAGFALSLPKLVPDIANVSGPPQWDHSAGVDVPHAVEWDRDDDNGGIMPHQTGVFSFTTLPRPWTTGDGLFHTWRPVPGQAAKQQFAFVNFDGQGPEVPDVNQSPLDTPEPTSLILFGIGGLAICCYRRRR